jgi:hypothetical protein
VGLEKKAKKQLKLGCEKYVLQSVTYWAGDALRLITLQILGKKKDVMVF